MSDPNERLPSSPAAALLEAPAAPERPELDARTNAALHAPLPADMTAQALPVPSGSPYRIPEQPAELALPYAPMAKPPRTVLGPALSVFAALLWTFVVAGQFTTSWVTGTPLGQGVAFLLVTLATFTAWVIGIRQSRIAYPPRQTSHLVWRAIGIAALAFALFFVCLAAAAAAGGVSSTNHDLLIPFVLVVVAGIAAIVGPKLTFRVRLQRTHRARVLLVIAWLAGALLTLIAGVDLAANG
jgi:hypothetical protein